MAQTIIVGLNCSGHDAAAALAIDGYVAAAIAEERLTRVKYKGGFPKLALDYCIREAGLDTQSDAVDMIVLNQVPFRHFDRAVRNYFAGGAIRTLAINPSHHYLHACYAEMLTPLRPLIILVVDGHGGPYAEHRRRGSPLLGDPPANEDVLESLTAYHVDEKGAVSLLIKDWGEFVDSGFPSLGNMYERAASRIFGSRTAAGKVMGLAPFGNPNGIGGKTVVTVKRGGIDVDTGWFVGVPKIEFTEHFEQAPVARDLAAKVQTELEKAMMHLCRLLREKTNCENLCLTGGVALNSVFNGKLAKKGIFKHVVITPASHDAGAAIGAAAYGHKQLTGRQLQFRADPEFLGHSYSDSEIEEPCRQASDVVFAKPDDLIERATEDLIAGKTVGWFEKEAEFGPRALGHRSILADPRRPEIRHILNARVKFRESFRPFAAAILEEFCSEWFGQEIASPHMLMVATVLPEKRVVIPAVLHVDNTCRVQTVSRTFPGSLRALIEAFFERTGVPLLLNTSLNILGAPIAETPQDAIDCVTMSGLDVLYCGPYRLEKKAHDCFALDSSLYLLPTADYSIVSRYVTSKSGTRVEECYVKQGTRKIRINVTERTILMKLVGRRPLAEFVKRFPNSTPPIIETVKSLCDRGILYLNSDAYASKDKRQ